MHIHKTKYSFMTTAELLSYAEQHMDTLPSLGHELMFRLEILHSGGNGNTEMTKEFLERQQPLV
jgi:hypothetical protein